MNQSAPTALLLLDYQVGLCRPGDDCLAPPLAAQIAERGVLEKAAQLLAAARASGALVVHIGLGFDETYELRTNRTARFERYPDNGLMRVGSPEAAFMPQVAPDAREPVLHKGCVDPFIGTSLRLVLASHGIERVVLAGVATNLVVESTARHASDSALDVVVVEDACASFSPEMHTFAVESTLPLFASVVASDAVSFSPSSRESRPQHSAA